MSKPVCRSYRGTIWNWYEEFASHVCRHNLGGGYRSQERGFRRVEVVGSTDSMVSEEDCLRPIRGDVWYFSTKSVASGKGGPDSYRKGYLGIRLVEEVDQ